MEFTPWSRRQFLQFLGASSTLPLVGGFAGCQTLKKKADLKALGFSHVPATEKDDLLLASGLSYKILISYDEPINSNGEKFGYNNDYIAYLPINENEGWLWVNHEATNPLFTLGRKIGDPITKAQVDSEMKRVGGSLLHIKNTAEHWEIVKNSKHNKRWDAKTPIPFAANAVVDGARTAIGTLANCAGGVTPWNTFLTAEENYHDYYGEKVYLDNGKTSWVPGARYAMWEKFYKHSPEHYGWIVEIDPKTKKAKKHTSMGRFAHECATVTRAKDGRIVVYTGDDANDQCLYKFISNSDKDLDRGTLYVADTVNGVWISLDIENNSKLKTRFKTQIEVQIRTREAAALVGGTPLNRPEDIEIDPRTGEVLVCLTNNKARGDFMGSILKVKESNQDHGSLTFATDTLITGGDDNGFACPDNMVFDRVGNLWFTTDISGGSIGKTPYAHLGNNGLFFVPMSGVNAGFAFRMASAPVGAEFTGPCFSPDYKTLFLSVQHPGEKTDDINNPSSRWPDFGKSLPRPAVVTIQGELLNKIQSL
jgi:secreted PhoX family phosphatase